MTTLPVFPLNALLLSDCKMPLQIFEKRYLDMVSHCMRTNTAFCVALLRPGSERHEVIRPEQKQANTGLPFYPLGTEAHIVDFGQRENGLLSITIQGGQRLVLTDVRQAADGLWMASAESRPEQADLDITDGKEWTRLLEQLLDMSGMGALGIDASAQSSEQLMNYLIMLLPLPAEVKQDLLETDSHTARWEKLSGAIALLSGQGNRQTHN